MPGAAFTSGAPVGPEGATPQEARKAHLDRGEESPRQGYGDRGSTGLSGAN